MHANAALLVREAADQHQLLGTPHLAEGPFAPHDVAVRHAHAVVVRASLAEVQVTTHDLAALGAEPPVQVFLLGPRVEHQLTRRIEHPAYDELVLGLHDRTPGLLPDR